MRYTSKKADFGTIVEPQGIFISTKKIVNVGEVMLHDREYSKDKTRLQIQTFGIAENSVVSVQHKNTLSRFPYPLETIYYIVKIVKVPFMLQYNPLLV